MANGKCTRRDAIRAASATFAAPYLIPSHVLGAGGRPGANERVNVAIIGLGGRARGYRQYLPGRFPECGSWPCAIVSAPLCDAFVQAVGKDQNWATYNNFRPDVRSRRTLDGVMVETTSHARAWVDDPGDAGGHGRLHREADVSDNCRRAVHGHRGAKVQSGDSGRHATALDADQQLGQRFGQERRDWVKCTRSSPQTSSVRIRWTNLPAQSLPQGGGQRIGGIVWTNQAEFRPYHTPDCIVDGPELVHRTMAAESCYGVTGWGTHSYDQIQRALGTDETGPVQDPGSQNRLRTDADWKIR